MVHVENRGWTLLGMRESRLRCLAWWGILVPMISKQNIATVGFCIMVLRSHTPESPQVAMGFIIVKSLSLNFWNEVNCRYVTLDTPSTILHPRECYLGESGMSYESPHYLKHCQESVTQFLKRGELQTPHSGHTFHHFASSRVLFRGVQQELWNPTLSQTLSRFCHLISETRWAADTSLWAHRPPFCSRRTNII